MEWKSGLLKKVGEGVFDVASGVAVELEMWPAQSSRERSWLTIKTNGEPRHRSRRRLRSVLDATWGC
jgi:hypothetical protein